jgi:serine/threonine protein kinase
MTRSSTCYREIRQIGEGAYGTVFLAEDLETRRIVALKKLPFFRPSKSNPGQQIREGVTITTLREISHLFKVEHENVVTLIEVLYGARPNQDLAC